MKKSFLLLFLAFISVSEMTAQNEYIDYRSTTNPLYWKNRKPFADYWQQDVHYTIKATLNDTTDIITGHEELTYWNNSPKDLYFVYFHLYNNAQTKDSYLADLYKNNNYHLKFNKYRKEGKGTEVVSIKNGNTELKTELDNTVMKVYLERPLKPGESITFDLDFKTYYAKEVIRNRMKLCTVLLATNILMSVHWYPRISVYDRKHGLGYRPTHGS
jgi:hypothetical protein